MSSLLEPANDRRAIRRAISLQCEAVSLDRYRLLSRQALDISSTGLLIAAEEPARQYESVLVHLFAGDEDIVAEAEVARVISGLRRHDRGAALGLRFTRTANRRLGRLLRRLRGTPPPIPARRIRRDYAAAIRAIHIAD